jgi:glycosyltransferase involved in cell wall biosynthesis
LRDLLSEAGARALLRRAAAYVRPTIIAVSQAVAEQARGLAAEVEVVYNGVPLATFFPGPPSPRLRQELGLQAGQPVLMIVARLTPWKGHVQLLRALPRVAERFPGVRLLVVGSPKFWQAEYYQELQALAAELGVAAHVLWLGHRKDVAELLRLCDVFVRRGMNLLAALWWRPWPLPSQ